MIEYSGITTQYISQFYTKYKKTFSDERRTNSWHSDIYVIIGQKNGKVDLPRVDYNQCRRCCFRYKGSEKIPPKSESVKSWKIDRQVNRDAAPVVVLIVTLIIDRFSG